MKFAFITSYKPRAQKALEELKSAYGEHKIEEADVVIALGGDGTMLSALHKSHKYKKPIFGMNLGTLGFLHNSYDPENLKTRIKKAQKIKIHPLQMLAIDKAGEEHKEIAFNDVSLLRETHRTAHLKIAINDEVRLDEIVCDGILLATAMGSTAYNSSAGGPIIPLDANVLPLTPISAFRPRRWSGALIKNTSHVKIDVLQSLERPVSATADSHEIRDVKFVEIFQSKKVKAEILFDPDNHLDTRISSEQFMV